MRKIGGSEKQTDLFAPRRVTAEHRVRKIEAPTPAVETKNLGFGHFPSFFQVREHLRQKYQLPEFPIKNADEVRPYDPGLWTIEHYFILQKIEKVKEL